MPGDECLQSFWSGAIMNKATKSKIFVWTRTLRENSYNFINSPDNMFASRTFLS